MGRMNLSKIFIPLGVVALMAAAWFQYQWPGVAMAGGAVVMWMLLHFTRMVTVLSRAANRPVGHVASAVMLNAKLKKGHALMHVIALTRALGQRLSQPDAQPEVFRWTDEGQSHVTFHFADGKLVKWALLRPTEESQEAS